MKRQKLELTWIGKETRPHLDSCILIDEFEKPYHAAHRFSDGEIFYNRLTFGDNDLALNAPLLWLAVAVILKESK